MADSGIITPIAIERSVDENLVGVGGVRDGIAVASFLPRLTRICLAEAAVIAFRRSFTDGRRDRVPTFDEVVRIFEHEPAHFDRRDEFRHADAPVPVGSINAAVLEQNSVPVVGHATRPRASGRAGRGSSSPAPVSSLTGQSRQR